jgi:hypothetical protein
MKPNLLFRSILACSVTAVAICSTAPTGSTPFAGFAAFATAPDPLPSWNGGPAKKAILDFVKATTDKNNPKFVPPEERIATFDQDGTTWVSHPIYSQVLSPLTGSLLSHRSIRNGRRSNPSKRSSQAINMQWQSSR